MGRITVHDDTVAVEDPVLVEGLPGLGLASKIATDFLIEELDMELYASVHSEGIPPTPMFNEGTYDVSMPIRIFVSEEHDLFALRSEVLVSPMYAMDIMEALVDWLREENVLGVFMSGLPRDQAGDTGLYGIATGAAGERLERAGIQAPNGPGMIGGPTGAFLYRANEVGVDALGLIVEADSQFPDPGAARVLIDQGVEPLTGMDVDTTELTESASKIKEQKEQLAEMMREAEQHERSQALPEEWYG